MTSSYQGISQGNSGFNPDPTPDYTKQIQQRNQDFQRYISRFNESVNANDTARRANAAMAGDGARALGKLSKTFGSVLGEIQKKRIEKFQNEAALLKARGLDTQEKIDAAREEQDRQEEELRQSSAELDKVKDKMVNNNEPFNVVQDVGKLNGYHIAELNRLNIIEQSKTFDSRLQAFIDEKIESGADGSADALVGYTKEFTSKFLNEFEDYSNSLVAKYALPLIQQGKAKRVQAIREQETADRSTSIVENATTQLLADNNLESFLNSVRFTKDRNGNYLGRKGALDLLETINQRQARAGNPLNFDILGESIASNGKPFKDHPRFEYLKDQKDDILEANFGEELAKEQRALKEIELNFYEAAASRDVPFSDAEIRAMQEDFERDTGRDRSQAPWLQAYETSTKRDIEDDKKKLDDLIVRRGFLIESDLRDVHPSVYKSYISTVKEHEPLAKPPAGHDAKVRTFVNGLVNQITDETDGTKDKSAKWQIAKDNVQAEFDRLYSNNIRSGMNQLEAYTDARNTLFTEFGKGSSISDEVRTKYSSVTAVEFNKERAQRIARAKTQLASGDDLSTSLIPGTYDELKQLDKYNKGLAEIPSFYYDVARDVKNITAWDIANAQYKAYTGNELGKGPGEEAFDAADPALQQVLNFKPTRSKIFRTKKDADYSDPAITLSGDTNLLKQAADITGKYEAGAAGYNAVNQIGIDGGHGTEGFSGDFRQMSQHGGKDLTTMTLGEIMDLQANSDMTNGQWIREGRLHAVGRYQFIGSTLKGLVNRLGIPLTTKFTPQLQDRLFASLLKSGGPSQWIGLTKATAQEMALINRARNSL